MPPDFAKRWGALIHWSIDLSSFSRCFYVTNLRHDSFLTPHIQHRPRQSRQDKLWGSRRRPHHHLAYTRRRNDPYGFVYSMCLIYLYTVPAFPSVSTTLVIGKRLRCRHGRCFPLLLTNRGCLGRLWQRSLTLEMVNDPDHGPSNIFLYRNGCPIQMGNDTSKFQVSLDWCWPIPSKKIYYISGYVYIYIYTGSSGMIWDSRALSYKVWKISVQNDVLKWPSESVYGTLQQETTVSTIRFISLSPSFSLSLSLSLSSGPVTHSRVCRPAPSSCLSKPLSL